MSNDQVSKKFFRDSDDKQVAGVCSGVALYFGLDVALVRVLFLLAFIFASAGFWVYVAIWLVVPEACTPEEKCALRGLPPTPENLSQFTYTQK